jgi:regulator of RNase E activity RraA
MEAKRISVVEMAERFRRIPSATLYDVLDSMGSPNQCLSLDIKPLHDDMKVSGPAFTVHGSREPRGEGELTDSPTREFKIFKAMYPQCVVVVNAEREEHCGHWGEMMSYAAKQHGATGIVIDGNIRDKLGLLNIRDWPVFVRKTTPIESNRRWRIHEIQVPIVMTGTLTSQVRVNPGDWIIGDADGVIAVPQEIALKVLLEAEKVEDLEEKSRRELSSNIPIEEVHRKYTRM